MLLRASRTACSSSTTRMVRRPLSPIVGSIARSTAAVHLLCWRDADTRCAAARRRARLPPTAPRRHRRRLFRPQGRGSVSLDGGPRLARSEEVGGGGKRAHLRLSGPPAAARGHPQAADRAVELRPHGSAGARGRPALLPAQRRAAEAVGALPGALGGSAGPEQDVARWVGGDGPVEGLARRTLA